VQFQKELFGILLTIVLFLDGWVELKSQNKLYIATLTLGLKSYSLFIHLKVFFSANKQKTHVPTFMEFII
jgi:hypothetical protein